MVALVSGVVVWVFALVVVVVVVVVGGGGGGAFYSSFFVSVPVRITGFPFLFFAFLVIGLFRVRSSVSYRWSCCPYSFFFRYL